MNSQARSPRAAAVATLASSHLVENISQGISNLNLSGQLPSDQRLWFIPNNLDSVPCIQKGPSHAKHKPLNHIPRPRNSFIIFRSLFLIQEVLPATIQFCRDNRQVSRIVSRVWKNISDTDKEHFYHLGDEEKRLHHARYPGYKITARRGKTKHRARYSPVNEGNLTPDEIVCKRIAELVLKNIQGEELERMIRDVVGATLASGWLNSAAISTSARTTRSNDDDMDANAITPPSRATKVRKSNKGRTKSRSTPKIRSSTSKKRQSKAALKMQPRLTLAVNRSRCSTPFSDDGWSGVDETNHTSEAGLSPPSVTTGSTSTDSFDSSADPMVSTSSRFVSPSIVGDAVGELFDWDADVAQTTPFDQDVSFEAYKDPSDSVVTEGSIYAAFGIHYPRGLYDYHTPEQSTHHAFQHGGHYGTTQVAMGEAHFTANLVVATPDPQTISPQCLL